MTVNLPSSTALYVDPRLPLPSISAEALINCSILQNDSSSAQKTKDPFFPIRFTLSSDIARAISEAGSMAPMIVLSISSSFELFALISDMLATLLVTAFFSAISVRCCCPGILFLLMTNEAEKTKISAIAPIKKPMATRVLLCEPRDGGAERGSSVPPSEAAVEGGTAVEVPTP